MWSDTLECGYGCVGGVVTIIYLYTCSSFCGQGCTHVVVMVKEPLV